MIWLTGDKVVKLAVMHLQDSWAYDNATGHHATIITRTMRGRQRIMMACFLCQRLFQRARSGVGFLVEKKSKGFIFSPVKWDYLSVKDKHVQPQRTVSV